jgi:hypothetical protein
VLAVCATITVAASAPTVASAAGPNTLVPGQRVTYPTWFWSSTTVCAQNNRNFPGTAQVIPRTVFGDWDTIAVPAYSTRCIQRMWWGNSIDVLNTSYYNQIPLTVWSY